MAPMVPAARRPGQPNFARPHGSPAGEQAGEQAGHAGAARTQSECRLLAAISSGRMSNPVVDRRTAAEVFFRADAELTSALRDNAAAK
jgi:hypothetical protein